MKKYINRNFFWADLFVTQLSKLGVKHVCISPGSRNTPLTLAFAQNKSYRKYIHVDERSSGFFALGIAKQTGQPVVIVTTSGTAVAELYPSIIEAYIQRIPLIVCTADRPEYLRNTGANQTINQEDIFSNHIRKFVDFGLPSLKSKGLKLYCKNTVSTCEIAIRFNPGPIHFNFPFKKPLEPNSFSELIKLKISDFILSPAKISANQIKQFEIDNILKYLKISKKPLIHCGWDNFSEHIYNKLVKFSKTNNIPLLVDGASQLRFYDGENNTIITNHSAFLLHLENQPDLILQFGNAPTSQSALNFFEQTSAKRILVNKYGDLKDPSKIKGQLLKADPILLLEELNRQKFNKSEWKLWLDYILYKDHICEENKKLVSNSGFGNESRIVNEVISLIPNNANLFVSNSLPIRDFDYFASKKKKGLKVYTNRGASGIDGIISTASGVSSQSNKPTFLIIGDLSFYHNISALSTLMEMKIPLKIILVNNNGGGIFNMLPVSDNSEHNIKYFTTPQNLNYGNIIKAFGGNYYSPKSWKNFRKNLIEFTKEKSYSVIEIKTIAKKSVELRKKYWEKVAQQLKLSNDSKIK